LFSLTGSLAHGAGGNVTPIINGVSIYDSLGLSGGATGVTGDVRLSSDVVIDRVTGSQNEYIISSRFSAPGGPEIQSYGYLDVYSQEYSVYNNLNYRNLTVRGGRVTTKETATAGVFYTIGGSGEKDTIRSAIHLPFHMRYDGRECLNQLLTRHCGKYGTDTRHVFNHVVTNTSLSKNPETFSTYIDTPSYQKQHRNENRRILSGSSIHSPDFVVRHDNAYINSPIPRSDYQYKWITSSLGSNYGVDSGNQRIYGYAPRIGILSSSVTINGESGFVPAITFPTASEIFGV